VLNFLYTVGEIVYFKNWKVGFPYYLSPQNIPKLIAKYESLDDMKKRVAKSEHKLVQLSTVDVSSLVIEKNEGKPISTILDELTLLCLLGVDHFIFMPNNDSAAEISSAEILPGDDLMMASSAEMTLPDDDLMMASSDAEMKFVGIHYRIPEQKKYSVVCQLIVELLLRDIRSDMVVSINQGYRSAGVVMRSKTCDLKQIIDIFNDLRSRIFPDYTKYVVEFICPMCIPMLFWPPKIEEGCEYVSKTCSIIGKNYRFATWQIRNSAVLTCGLNHSCSQEQLLGNLKLS